LALQKVVLKVELGTAYWRPLLFAIQQFMIPAVWCAACINAGFGIAEWVVSLVASKCRYEWFCRFCEQVLHSAGCHVFCWWRYLLSCYSCSCFCFL